MSHLGRDALRADVIEEVATALARWYPDNVSMNAFCAAVRSLSESSRCKNCTPENCAYIAGGYGRCSDADALLALDSNDGAGRREELVAAWLHGHCRARGFTFAETDIPGCKGSFLWNQALREVEALSALTALAAGREWQPIETAPKDGTNVIVCRAGEDRSVGVSFFFEGAWQTWDAENHTRTSFIEGYLTHWRSLPVASALSDSSS